MPTRATLNAVVSLLGLVFGGCAGSGAIRGEGDPMSDVREVAGVAANGEAGIHGGRPETDVRLLAAPAPTPSTDPIAEAEPPPPPPPPPESLSPPLACGLRSPMPGSYTAGYAIDTGLDLAGIKMNVHAIADGKVIYAEGGHSRWSSPRDTDLAVLIELDEAIPAGDRKVTHVWYAHLSELAFEQPRTNTKRRRVVAGERLGTSGVANGSWHLHLGLLLDGNTSQRWGTYLVEDEAREVLCGLRPRQRLPPMEKPRRAARGR